MTSERPSSVQPSPLQSSPLHSSPTPALLNLPLVALVMANLIPLVGVLSNGWSVLNVMLVFVGESVIIGLYTVLKMALAQGQATAQHDEAELDSVGLDGAESDRAGDTSTTKIDKPKKRWVMIPFFIAHFGGFCAIHAAVVLQLLGDDAWGVSSAQTGGLFDIAQLQQVMTTGMWISLGSLLVSHGISFYWYFVRGGDYRRATVSQLFSAPYKRVFVMHVSVILGALLVMKLGSAVWMLCLLIALKIGLDMRQHRHAHAGENTASHSSTPSARPSLRKHRGRRWHKHRRF